MTSRGLTEQTPALRLSALPIAALALVCALALSACGAGTLSVQVDGRSLSVPAGTAVGDLLARKMLVGSRGDLLGAKSHTVVRAGVGGPVVVLVNGSAVPTGTKLASGDVVTASKGADTVESVVSRTETFAPAPEYVGSGSVHTVLEPGKVGTRKVTIGAVSGQILESTVTVAPVAQVVLRTKPPSGKKVIALTFDDGPQTGSTLTILKILQDNGVKATFFEIGSHAKKHPELTRALIDAGMVVGNHSETHPDLKKLSASAIQSEISQAQANITAAGGRRPTLFRPPGGALNDTVRAIVAKDGLHIVMWNDDTYDWNYPPSNTIVTRALKRAKDGTVVIMHDGGGDRSNTIGALPLLIRALKMEGFTFVTIEQLRKIPQKMG